MLADPRVVRESTITELAGTSASAASTVARFCQRLGFDGYRQFRAAVIAALGYDDARLGEFDLGEGEIDAGDAPEEIAAKIAFQEVRAIQATMAALDLDATARGRGARRGEADRALRRRLVVADRAGPSRLRSGATASRIAQLAIVDVLFVLVLRLDFPQLSESLRVTYDAVRSRRGDH